MVPSGVMAKRNLHAGIATLFCLLATLGPDARKAAAASFGSVTIFNIPQASVSPFAITAGSDGSLWFVERDGYKVDSITTSGTLHRYNIPTSGSQPEGITAGPDGA